MALLWLPPLYNQASKILIMSTKQPLSISNPLVPKVHNPETDKPLPLCKTSSEALPLQKSTNQRVLNQPEVGQLVTIKPDACTGSEAMTGKAREPVSVYKTRNVGIQLNLKALDLGSFIKDLADNKVSKVNSTKEDLAVLNNRGSIAEIGRKMNIVGRKKRLRKKFVYRTGGSKKIAPSSFRCSNKVDFRTDNVLISPVKEKKPILESSKILESRSTLVLESTNNENQFSYSTTHILTELKPFLKALFNLSFDRLQNITLDYDQLSRAAAIINTKFQVEFPIRSLYSITSFNSLCSLKPNKRPEESYKFVFKHAYKNLKQRFRTDRPELSKLGFNDLNLQFYRHYFQETAEKLGIGINNFFLPLTPDSYCNKKLKVIAQTINVSYITLVCQSRLFMDNFMAYVNQSFIPDYSELINTKVDNLCDKWENLYIEAFGNEKIIGFICEYVHLNKKCKLPWTIKEVEFAVEIVNKLVQKCKRRGWVKSKSFDSLVLKAD